MIEGGHASSTRVAVAPDPKRLQMRTAPRSRERRGLAASMFAESSRRTLLARRNTNRTTLELTACRPSLLLQTRHAYLVELRFRIVEEGQSANDGLLEALWLLVGPGLSSPSQGT